MPPSKKREYIALHMSVSGSGLSGCPSVTFSFPINNSRVPWPTFLKLCLHILGSRGTLLILRSLGQRSRSPWSNVSKPFPINNLTTPRPTFPHTWSTHTSWVADEPYWFWGHWVKGQCHKGQMFQNHFKLFNFLKWISLCNLFWTDLSSCTKHLWQKKL